MENYKSRLKNIKAFVFDVDGVFTNGQVILMPDGSMSRMMNVLDGYALAKAHKLGYLVCIITGGNDAMVKSRLTALGINEYYPASPYKLKDYEDFKQKYQLNDDEILTMGDDIPDICMLTKSSIAVCPTNAVPEVKEVCHYISPIHGGEGAVRDIIKQVLKAQNKWEIDQITKSI